jgi:hypothetical protein
MTTSGLPRLDSSRACAPGSRRSPTTRPALPTATRCCWCCLGLTEDERRYLHRLAHGHVGRPRPLADEATAEQIVRQLVATAADSPYPVYAANIYGDLIAWNPAAKVYYTDFGKLPRSGAT